MFTLKISTANEAFGNDTWDASLELARILRTVADRFEHYGFDYEGDSDKIRDINGNTVGKWELK